MKPILGNKCTEKDIRDWLTKNGYVGQTARFSEIELHAIRRPGWHQVYRFETSCVTAENIRVQLFGVVNSDERYNLLDMAVFLDVVSRNEQLAIWSEGFIVQTRHRS